MENEKQLLFWPLPFPPFVSEKNKLFMENGCSHSHFKTIWAA